MHGWVRAECLVRAERLACCPESALRPRCDVDLALRVRVSGVEGMRVGFIGVTFDPVDDRK